MVVGVTPGHAQVDGAISWSREECCAAHDRGSFAMLWPGVTTAGWGQSWALEEAWGQLSRVGAGSISGWLVLVIGGAETGGDCEYDANGGS